MKGSAYTIGFAAALGLICALLLTAAADFTKPYKEANQQADNHKNQGANHKTALGKSVGQTKNTHADHAADYGANGP